MKPKSVEKILEELIVKFEPDRKYLEKSTMGRLLLSQAAKEIKEFYLEVQFNEKELEYIYNYLNFAADKELYKSIENKIRKKIPKYEKFDKDNSHKAIEEEL